MMLQYGSIVGYVAKKISKELQVLVKLIHFHFCESQIHSQGKMSYCIASFDILFPTLK